MPQVCTACCSQRKRLLIASAAEGVPGTDALIQRKFVDQWKINWSHGAPPAKVIEDLQALSATDKVKPIQLCGHSTEDVSLSLPAIFCSHSIKRLRRLPLIAQSLQTETSLSDHTPLYTHTHTHTCSFVLAGAVRLGQIMGEKPSFGQDDVRRMR